MMKRKHLLLLIAFLLLVTGFIDIAEIRQNPMQIKRAASNREKKSYDYDLTIEGLVKNHPYKLEIEPKEYTTEEIDSLFAKVKEDIDKEFLGNNEDPNHISENLFLRDEYLDGQVSVEWTSNPYGVILSHGEIDPYRLQKYLDRANTEGLTVKLQGIMTISSMKNEKLDYEKELVLYQKFDDLESAMIQIEEQVEEQRSNDLVTLPQEVGEKKITWNRKRNHYTIKVVLFLLVIGILLRLRKREVQREERKEREKLMLIDYPDILGKFTVFVGTGMTISQALNKIVELNQIKEKKKRKSINRPAYEELKYTMYQIAEGESERSAYQKFADRVALADYRRFVRILLQQKEKGGSAFLSDLTYEMESAYRSRRTYTKKLAEEAGSKLLLPMMLLFMVVLAVVIAPALLTMGI